LFCGVHGEITNNQGEFHCPFAASQLRRLAAKGPRNTGGYGVLPRAAHAFSVLALGWYVSRFQRFCRFAAMKCRENKRLFWLKQLTPRKSLC